MGRAAHSRREFLVTTASAVVGCVAMRQVTTEERRLNRLRAAELHYHVLPPVALPFDGRRPAPPASLPVELWNPRETIVAMDAIGVGFTVLSMPTSSFRFSALGYRAHVRACNEWAAGVAREYRGYLGFFASIPLPDVNAAVQEAQYACDVLGADGAFLATSYGVRWIGDPAFEPLLEALDRRGALVSVHPPGTSCCHALSRYLHYGEEVLSETEGALASLRANARLSRFTQIRYLFAHHPTTRGPLSSTQL